MDSEWICQDEDIRIVGCKEFIEATINAIELIRLTYAFIEMRKHLKCIRQSNSSYAEPRGKQPTYWVGEPTWKSDVSWYASTIVHDACHIVLYYEYQVCLLGVRFTLPWYWKGATPERICMLWQLTALEQINAPDYMKSHLVMQIVHPYHHRIPFKDANWTL